MRKPNSGIGNDIIEIDILKQFVDKSFRETLIELKEKHNRLVIGLRRNNQTIVNPNSNENLKQEDSLLMICAKEESEKNSFNVTKAELLFRVKFLYKL